MVLEKKIKAEGRKLKRRAGGELWGNWGLGDNHAVCVSMLCVSVPFAFASVLVLLQDIAGLNIRAAASRY